MDPTLLMDPGFWMTREWFAPAGFPGTLTDHPDIGGQLLFETSGSSGKPKWIVLSKEALLLSAAAVNRHLKVDETSRWGLSLPLHHVGGFGVMARTFEAACNWSRFESKWQPVAFTQWLEREKISHLSLVPTQVHDLVSTRQTAPKSLEAIVVGGGKLDVATGQAARDLGWPVLASYGMTEACSQIATQSLDLLDKPYQTGNIPILPIWKTRTDDENRLSISGPALFTGILEFSNGNWVFSARQSPWHQTADRVLLDQETLTPLGRGDLMVKIMGELVDPLAIEHEIVTLSGGEIATGTFAVVALPSARNEHRLVVVFAKSHDCAATHEVLQNYNKSAPGFRRLEQTVFLEKLPLSELGKIRRGEIVTQII
ncbi:AMP-binding protein [Luteolibacter pohnpeiensis]|uniref:AMP-binding protein n=1 Tax=Luteolibacter pohnpeiensis TaxID=454153 RepID=A0A934VQA5_9BACT|nr:AMP-binding protein [Luteolibacter pohnpeiensis]MBK1881901.1 AMP-binding protein [Luteolibacter pohnpeiensis]